MISARAIDLDIRNNDATFCLFCSVAAKGEARGAMARTGAELGWSRAQTPATV